MLVLLQKELAEWSLARIAVPRSGNRVLIPDALDESSAGWTDLHSRESSVFSGWLRQVLAARPARNRIFVLWRQIDSDLERVLDALPTNDADYELTVSIFVVGPEQRGDAGSALGRNAASLQNGSTRVWYLGNEDTARSPIDDAARQQLLERMVQILAALDDTRAASLGLWVDGGGPDEAIHLALEPGATVSSGRCFAVPGLKFWGHQLAEYPRLIRLLALDVLRSQLIQGGVDNDERLVAQFPGTLLSRLHDRDIPYGGPQEALAARLSQRFSSPGDVVAGWACPLLAGHAEESAKVLLRAASRQIQQYYCLLIEELSRIAKEVRQQGAASAGRAKSEIRGQVERCTDLGRLAMLLRVFFPQFERIWTERFDREKSPCEAAHDPSWNDVHRDVIGAAEVLLNSRTAELPSTIGAAVGGVAVLALFILGGTLWSKGFSMRVVLTPPAVGIAAAGGGFLFAWWRARSITRELRSHFERTLAALRDRFVRKADWVIDNTHLAAKIETVAHARNLGRRLQRNFDDFIGDWREVEKGEGYADGDSTRLADAWGEDEVEEIRQQIRDAAMVIRDAVLNDREDGHSGDKIRELLTTLSARAFTLASRHPSVPGACEKELLQIAGSLTQPPLAARLEGYTIQGKLSRTFALPDSYPDTWDSRLISRSETSGVPTKVVRAGISGPAVWMTCGPLTYEEFVESLKTTQFSA